MKSITFLLLIYLLMPAKIVAQAWSPVGGGTNDWVRSLCVYDDALYAGGDFISAGGVVVSGVAKWDGTNWSAFGTPSNVIQFLKVYNNELFEGGSMGFSKWDGTDWVTVGTGGPGGHVYTLEVFNNKLYAAGHTSGIYQWDGSSWSIIGTPSSDVYALCSFNGELYAAGAFTTINSIPASAIAKWDGSVWSSVDAGILGGSLDAMDSYNNELYVGGIFTSGAGNVGDYIMKWNGSNWLSVGSSASGRVMEIDSIDGNLYIGGYFSSVSGVNANGIAFFDGSAWNAMGSGINSGSNLSTVTKFQGSIYAGGTFTVAGGDICLHIAKWDNSTGIIEMTGLNHLSIFPNPIYSSAILKSVSELQNANLSICNIFGQEVKKIKNISGQEIRLQRDNLQGGLYYIYLTQDNKTMMTDKIVIID
ncbi:MAG TPA: T9SS type A sorting domain-containing protein [Chitinophagales bacterium]|nr:T9SS type A sorting domain-containing protein [Chitinophagales bacterium]